MSALPDMQQAMSRAIRRGPGHIPYGLFAGDARRVLLGFAIHANTVSHARLTALEDTFPRALAYAGRERFNAWARAYVEAGHGAGEPLADIGCDFGGWLEREGECDAGCFARFDWAWLESYRAAEGEALTLALLTACDEVRLLAMSVSLHPATRLVTSGTVLCTALGIATAPHVLIVRPEADVNVLAADGAMASFCQQAAGGVTIGSAFEALAQDHETTAILGAVQALFAAGALIPTGDGQC